MANAYFTLANSDDSVRKKFRVILGGYDEITDKKTSVDTTIEGVLDIAQGSIQQRWSFVVKVRAEEPSDGDIYLDDFGTKEDLKYFFMLNRPNDSPSDIITFTDHYGDNHFIKMVGNFQANALGVMVDGENAWFLVNTQFLKVG